MPLEQTCSFVGVDVAVGVSVGVPVAVAVSVGDGVDVLVSVGVGVCVGLSSDAEFSSCDCPDAGCPSDPVWSKAIAIAIVKAHASVANVRNALPLYVPRFM